ncbi:unnamed protein product [Colias eurytheme]|nr:unnamed protein product [Colias eurytheme]
MADIVMSSDEEPEVAPGARPASGSSGRRINPYSSEIRSMWNWRRVFSRLGTEEQCVEFAEQRNLLPRVKMCAYHKRPMTFTPEAGQVQMP